MATINKSLHCFACLSNVQESHFLRTLSTLRLIGLQTCYTVLYRLRHLKHTVWRKQSFQSQIPMWVPNLWLPLVCTGKRETIPRQADKSGVPEEERGIWGSWRGDRVWNSQGGGKNKRFFPTFLSKDYITTMFSRQQYWSGLPFPSPVDHILSDLSYINRDRDLMVSFWPLKIFLTPLFFFPLL